MQQVQKICSYGMNAATDSFKQATLKFKLEKLVSISRYHAFNFKPFYSCKNQLNNSAGFWEIIKLVEKESLRMQI